ncbi:MAG: RNA polymerase sigma factor [Bacillota bacterium]
MVHPSDTELIQCIAAGQQSAMHDLYSRYARRLFRFAVARLGSRSAAEDVVQETLVAVWQSAGRYRGTAPVSTWLFGICRNKVGDQLRRRELAREPLQLAEVLGSAAAGTAALEFWEAFGQLSDEQQELILLVFHHGLRQEEVAEILGIPLGTVKSRTYHARKRLQTILEGGEADEPMPDHA